MEKFADAFPTMTVGPAVCLAKSKSVFQFQWKSSIDYERREGLQGFQESLLGDVTVDRRCAIPLGLPLLQRPP